jgi:hypothetical protein
MSAERRNVPAIEAATPTLRSSLARSGSLPGVRRNS